MKRASTIFRNPLDRSGSGIDEDIDKLKEYAFFYKEFGLKVEEVNKLSPKILDKLSAYYHIKDEINSEKGVN